MRRGGGGRRGTEGGAPASSDCSSCDNSLSVVSQTICPVVGRLGSCEVALCQHTGTATQQRHVQTVDELKEQNNIKCQSKVSGHSELPAELECTLAKILEEVSETIPDNYFIYST